MLWWPGCERWRRRPEEVFDQGTHEDVTAVRELPYAMRLQSKFVTSISCAVLAVLLVSEWVRQRHDQAVVAALSHANLDRLREATRDNVHNLQLSLNAALRESMEQGEMDRLARILTQQNQIEGLLECSVLDAHGRVQYSSQPAAIGRTLERGVREEVMKRRTRVERNTGEAFEIYHPVEAEVSCLECHQDWEPGQIAGFELLRYSNAAFKQAEQEWAALGTGCERVCSPARWWWLPW